MALRDAMLAVVPDPASPDLARTLDLAGYAWRAVSAGDGAIAGEVLTKGYTTAASRGDRLPQKAMGELLTKLGLPVPQVGGAASAMQSTASNAGAGFFMVGDSPVVGLIGDRTAVLPDEQHVERIPAAAVLRSVHPG